MAISKLILNDEVQMDVTSNTNTASNMLSGVVGTKNDGTSVTGNIPTKTSSDLTASGATVTAPAGYYANAASKSVTTTTHPNPSASIASSTGVVTASHTQSTGYVTSGTTTSTMQLTSQVAATYYPSTTDQTIASYRWLTGTQTIKSVTTSNLTAANIAEGVTVKVGDVNNASRISQVTGTYAPTTSSLTVTPTETAQTFNATGVYGYKPVTINAISSTYVGTGVSQRSAADITKNTNEITAPMGYYSQSATYTVPTYSHTSPSIGFTSSTGIIEATHDAQDVMQNWGMLTGYTTTSSEYALTTQAAQTIYPSTADQTIYSYRWLTGNQTIKSVVTSNLTAANIAEGVVVQVGDTDNASRITQITGTHSGATSYTATITGTGGAYLFVRYPGDSGTYYDTGGDTFNIEAGETIYLRAEGSHGGGSIYVNNILVASGGFDAATYNYEVPSNTNVEILLSYDSYGYIYVTESISEIQITENGTYNVSEYDFADVNVAGGGSDAEDAIIQRTISGAYENSRISTIGDYAFANCYSLTTVSFPNVTSIGINAFYNCYSLTTVSFPSVTKIGVYAFAYCYPLTTASFSNVTIIAEFAFASCYSLTTVSFPSATIIGSSAFRNCSSLTTVSFPSATKIGNSAFTNCTHLTTASFPNVTTIGSYAFAYCYSFTTANFPSVISIGNSAFRSCFNLVSAIFLASSVVSLGTSAFYSTPIDGYTTSTGGVYGSIFVPASLYNSYITATNWSLYSARIVGISWNTLINETVTVTTMGLRGAVLSTTTTSLENVKTAKITINNIEYICSQYIDNENNVPIYRYGAQQNGYDEESLPIMDWSIYPFEIYNYNMGNNYVTILIVDSNKFAENESVVVKFEEQINSLP